MTPVIIVWALLTSNPVTADTWPGFRGDGSGVTPAENLPVRWTPEDGVAASNVTGYVRLKPPEMIKRLES